MVAHFSLLSSRLNCCFLRSPSILRCTVFRSIFLSVVCSHCVCVCVRTWESDACVCCRSFKSAPFHSAVLIAFYVSTLKAISTAEWNGGPASETSRWRRGYYSVLSLEKNFYQLQLLSEDLKSSYYKLTDDKNEICANDPSRCTHLEVKLFVVVDHSIGLFPQFLLFSSLKNEVLTGACQCRLATLKDIEIHCTHKGRHCTHHE